MLRPQSFVNDGRLLIEDHPGHDHRPDVARHQKPIPRVAPQSLRQRSRHRRRRRVGHHRYPHERQLEAAQRQRHRFHLPIGAGGADHDQKRPRQGHADPGPDAEQQPHSFQPDEFRDQRADAGDHQRARRQPGPGCTKPVPDQLTVAFAGRQAKPDRQLLDQVQHRHQRHLQPQQLIAVARPALRRGNDAAGVGVGQHDHQPRSGRQQQQLPPGNGVGMRAVLRRRAGALPSRTGAGADLGQPILLQFRHEPRAGITRGARTNRGQAPPWVDDSSGAGKTEPREGRRSRFGTFLNF